MSDADASPSGQFDFLNTLRKQRSMVTLYLVNGIRLQGRIVSFDRHSVLLQAREGEVLIQNQAISTVGKEPPGRKPPREGARPGGERTHRPREAGEGAGLGRPLDRPPREYLSSTERGSAGGERPPRTPGGYLSRGPRPDQPAPTVTIVRKGLRRLRTPEGEGGTPPSDAPADD